MVEFSCKCGYRLSAPDSSAGKRAKCPECKADLTIPTESQQPPEASPEEKFELTCPKCGRKWEGNAKICMECGYNVVTDESITTEVDEPEKTGEKRSIIKTVIIIDIVLVAALIIAFLVYWFFLRGQAG